MFKGNVGDIPNPERVSSLCFERPFHQVLHDAGYFWFSSNTAAFPVSNGSQSHPLHLAGNPVLAGEQATFAQFQGNPGTAISAFEFFIYLQNGFSENLLIDGSLAFTAFLPVIIRLGADSQHFTHQPHRIDIRMFSNKSILGYSASFKNA